jgi:MYXO-CTERM domain-containing protein
MNSMLSNNHRWPTCNGWLGLSHYVAAGWDSDEGQRIGPAYEIEGTTPGSGPSTAASSGAGGAASGATSGAGGTGPKLEPTQAEDRPAGCACRMSGEPHAYGSLLALLAALALVTRRKSASHGLIVPARR